ncbi:kisspeptin 2 [Synchiropus splendidus]|uniref:kisspeptin 2 n=1 Tax=Synchiropus splendidus TaxID=270530 RepID=UPI00237E0247|nr:kisspeptin 2 [Synchiropus splendidus]
MRLSALVLVCGLAASLLGGSLVSGLDSEQIRQGAGSVVFQLRRSPAGEYLEDPSMCITLRENDDQRHLLCNDRRSQFNFNPFGLRFGKRFSFRRAVKRARRNQSSVVSLFPRRPEILI